jgi:uroporphyrin-III C-methyltransferase
MFLPIALNVENKLCLIVGGGVIAAHKCRVLLEHGAIVRAVSTSFSDDPVWSDPRIERVCESYRREQLSGAALCIAATSDRHVNHSAAQHAGELSIPALNVSAPGECDWIMPATLRRGAFTVSFGTDGLFPALAAHVKKNSAALFGDDLSRLCEEARRLREEAKAHPGGESEHPLRALSASLAAFWQPRLPSYTAETKTTGKVFLVGAGPGDIGLITVKGASCLRAASVVIHDALANRELLDIFCSGAVRVDVSKRKGLCLHMQPEINQMLIDWARRGHTVVRLKGGDPMIFGRGGEEARALTSAGIPFEIVPGVSSLSAVPAYAGIPVTDREFGSASIGVYSLHRRNNAGLSEDQWRGMAQGAETLVLFMGMSLLSTVVEKLLQYGRSEAEPIALITQGTTSRQQEIVATLGTILTRDELRTAGSPGLIVVGSVVKAYGLLPWFNPQEANSAAQAMAFATPDSAPSAGSASVAVPQHAASSSESHPQTISDSTAIAAPALIHTLLRSPMDGEAIETLSLATIDREAPPNGYSPDEWAVVRRLIHTSADFAMIDLVRFSSDAIGSARRALRTGAPIFADSNMIRAGISLARLRSNCPSYSAASIHCHVADPDVAAEARSQHLPRSLFAVRKAAPLLDCGIALFGNAPVALMELNRAILEDGIRPALVIAMPVGFVHVEESKQELMSLNVPWISIPGRRGGSTLAVATLHALCMLNGGSAQ